MKPNTKMALIFCLALALVYVVWKPVSNAPALPHIVTSKTARTPSRTIHILFIGGSYTFMNDLPGMLVKIASSDPADTIAVQIASVTRENARLIDLWKANLAGTLLSSKHWDYVVLQEQSEWAMQPTGISMAYEGVEKFDDAIRKNGAVPLFYETWQRQPGSQWYRNPRTAYLGNAVYMQQMLHYQTYMLATKLKTSVIPAGSAWNAVLTARPNFPLYLPDGSHPSVTGTYLVALMFYHTLIKSDVHSVEFTPSGMDAANAAYLRNFVSGYGVASR